MADRMYKYMVTYFTSTGDGRTFVETNFPINTEERVLEVERVIAETYGREGVGLTNWIEVEG